MMARYGSEGESYVEELERKVEEAEQRIATLEAALRPVAEKWTERKGNMAIVFHQGIECEIAIMFTPSILQAASKAMERSP